MQWLGLLHNIVARCVCNIGSYVGFSNLWWTEIKFNAARWFSVSIIAEGSEVKDLLELSARKCQPPAAVG